MNPDVLSSREAGERLVKNAGVVLDRAFQLLDRHFPFRRFRRNAVYRDVVVAAGEQDQFSGRRFIGLGEVAPRQNSVGTCEPAQLSQGDSDPTFQKLLER